MTSHKTIAITNAKTKAPKGYGITVVGDSYAWAHDEEAPKVAKVAKVTKPKSLPCRCGCGGETRGGRFLPGHDGRLKGLLLGRAHQGDSAALAELADLGWAHFYKPKAEKATEPVAEPVAESVAEPTPQPKKRDMTVRGKRAAKVA